MESHTELTAGIKLLKCFKYVLFHVLTFFQMSIFLYNAFYRQDR